MTPTDTTERGLEVLIVRTMTGAPMSSPRACAARDGRGIRRGQRLAAWRRHTLRPRLHGRSGAIARLHSGDQEPLVAALSLDETARPAGSSWRASRARSASAGSLTCCGRACNTAHIMWTCSTARRRQGTRRRRRGTPRTVLGRAPTPLQPRRDAAALDLALFINGLPIATFELKNSLTKQTVDDLSNSTSATATPRAALRVRALCRPLRGGRPRGAVLHAPEGKASWFLPFNQGWNDGAGNPRP